jgi:hypothetical protein
MTSSRILVAVIMACVSSGSVLLAQWPAYPDSKVPRTADGRPNFDAPTPRTPDGKPDLSGVWLNEWFYGGQVRQPLVSPPGEPPASTFANIGAGFPDGLPFQPWAKELMAKRKEQNSKDNPDAHCLPMGLMQFHEHPQPRRMLQTPGVLVILYEGTPAYVKSSPTAVLFRTTTRNPGGMATRPAAGTVTPSSSRPPVFATADGWTSGAAR